MSDLLRDSLEIYEAVQKGEGPIPATDPSHTLLFGDSFGGALALNLATQVQSLAIITHCTFHSYKRMKMGGRMPWTYYLALKLLAPFSDNVLENDQKFAHIRTGSFCGIHAQNDSWYSAQSLENLVAAAEQAQIPTLKFLLERGGHRNAHRNLSAAQRLELRSFIDAHRLA
jgi:dienelactone hydrolase